MIEYSSINTLVITIGAGLSYLKPHQKNYNISKIY